MSKNEQNVAIFSCNADMNVRLSRHCQRRIKLYDIPEAVIFQSIEGIREHTYGKHIILKLIDNFKYPIKIVYSVDGENIIVITAYPLKKGVS